MNNQKIKKALLQKRTKTVISEKNSLSCGSTLLNLACTDQPRCGLVEGRYYFLVGDSTSGKTWLSLTCFAESRLHPKFKNYELHLDDVEGGADMNIEHFFGKKVAQDIKIHNSQTIEDFYRNLWDLLRVRKKRIIYVLDSQDALDSIAAEKKFAKQKKANEKGENAAGSWGDGKARYHSQNIRWVMSGLRKTGSILIIIGQTRDNLGALGWADKKTRSGGKSLRFYANTEIWTSCGKPLVKIVREKKRIVGMNAIAEVRKNRITGKIGKSRSAVIPIYNSFGIDDAGSMVDFLIEEGHFTLATKKPKTWKIPGIDFSGSRREIIHFFEEHDSLEVLQDMTASVWREIEEECRLVNRRKRYL